MKLPLCISPVLICMVLNHAAQASYPIADTAQEACYDNHAQISPPRPGEPFYGQDAQFKGNVPSYSLGRDGLTVQDNVTGLTWQRSPDTNRDGRLDATDKLTFSQATKLPAQLNSTHFGGFSDWRLPNIKELYSLILFSGIDPSGPEPDLSELKPFLDTRFFQFAYGSQAQGERIIDSQYASCTRYVAKSFLPGADKLFGVNFADGRIKGYDLSVRGPRPEKTFFVLCVRGNPGYGQNSFHDNGNGTVTDSATGLVWSKTDSGKGMNWQEALAWAQERNAQKHLGQSDWRLPNAKELQSIVDYSRSPETSDSAAIDPVFECTSIKNEVGQPDFPFYWSSTTHAGLRGGASAVYIAFGRACGWLGGRPLPPMGAPEREQRPRREMPSGEAKYVDIHGAGAQRSDPKEGSAKDYPKGRGPQGDVVRIENFVRLVRGGLGSRP